MWGQTDANEEDYHDGNNELQAAAGVYYLGQNGHFSGQRDIAILRHFDKHHRMPHFGQNPGFFLAPA
jgi:hypothetical protein